MPDVTHKVAVTFKLVDGDPKDEDWILDAFAAKIGRDNTAKPPLTFVVDDGDGHESRYEVKLVDEA